jgi:hypothetical protein
MIDDKDKIKNDDSELNELSSEQEWCHYSGMPSPMAYMNLSDDEEDEHKEEFNG